MGRRGLHNEGSEILQERLEGQGRGRFRHGAPAVHADLRAALARLSRGRQAGSPRSSSSAGGTPCARRWRGRWPSISFPAASTPPRPASLAGERDPFVDAVLAEIGLDLGDHRPHRHRGPGRPQLRPRDHAVAGGASPHAGADAHAGDRRGILADARPDARRRLARADPRRLSRPARAPRRAHPRAARRACR